MNLEAIKAVKNSFDEEKDIIRQEVEMAKGFLLTELPAIPESDRAAVAWFVCELLNGMVSMPVRKVGDVMMDSATAYGLAAVSLLGWNGEQ
jgi:hypothetical protein